MADNLAKVGDLTFQQEALDSESTVVVDFLGRVVRALPDARTGDRKAHD